MHTCMSSHRLVRQPIGWEGRWLKFPWCPIASLLLSQDSRNTRLFFEEFEEGRHFPRGGLDPWPSQADPDSSQGAAISHWSHQTFRRETELRNRLFEPPILWIEKSLVFCWGKCECWVSLSVNDERKLSESWMVCVCVCVPGPGKGCLHTRASLRPNSLPSSLTSSLW